MAQDVTTRDAAKEAGRRSPRRRGAQEPRGQHPPVRHAHRPAAARRDVLLPHRRALPRTAQRHLAARAERLHPDPRHRHGDGDHRRAHRPVGRLGERLRRCLGRTGHGALGPALADGDPARPGPRHPRRHVAGLLGGLHRHPGVHRHPGRHAPVPRPGPDDPRRPVDPGARGLPEDRQRLPARHGSEHRVPQPDTGAHPPRDRGADLLRAEEPRRPQEVRHDRAADGRERHQAGLSGGLLLAHRHAAGQLQGRARSSG